MELKQHFVTSSKTTVYLGDVQAIHDTHDGAALVLDGGANIQLTEINDEELQQLIFNWGSTRLKMDSLD